MPDSIKIIETRDGSHTLLHEKLDETYHSSHGALTESKHVFLKEGLELFLVGKESASVLEIGFGTGLNAILTWQKARELGKSVDFTTLEPYPIPPELIPELNYAELIGEQLLKDFLLLHKLEWNEIHQLEKYFLFQKLTDKLEEFDSNQKFDVIYFDAFAPQKQPELWEMKVLERCYQLLNKGGIMTTYCAQGQFKRDLKVGRF